jgi:tetratricopeptide (TPR) repeat protein
MKNKFAFAVATGLLAATTLCAQDPARTSIWLPARPWALQMQAPGFSVEKNDIQPDGRRYFLAQDKANRMVASVYLEAMSSTPAAGECERSLHDKEARFSPLSSQGLKDVVYSEKDGMEILEYLLPDAKGAPIKQHNVFACLIKDNVFVDIHLSKSLYTPADKPAFDDLLASFRFVDKAPSPATPTVAANAPRGNTAPAGSALQLFRKGSFYYISQKFQESIGPYQQALDLEKANPTLEKKLWYVLVDNLTIAYGITGDLANSESIAKYGISQDPNYPLFYYNLACAAAEKGDVAGAKTNLKLAYDRRANVLPGETFADARSDDSFQKLMQRRDFSDFANKLYSQP